MSPVRRATQPAAGLIAGRAHTVQRLHSSARCRTDLRHLERGRCPPQAAMPADRRSSPRAATPVSEPPAASPALAELARALYPVLRARDAQSFRRLLVASEDELGDMSELAALPTEELQRLMRELLRDPTRYGLPRWPAGGSAPCRRPAGRAPGDTMPLYDFRCPACSALFERRLPLSALGQSVPCPQCGAQPSQRLVSLPAAPTRSNVSTSAPAAAPT